MTLFTYPKLVSNSLFAYISYLSQQNAIIMIEFPSRNLILLFPTLFKYFLCINVVMFGIAAPEKVAFLAIQGLASTWQWIWTFFSSVFKWPCQSIFHALSSFLFIINPWKFDANICFLKQSFLFLCKSTLGLITVQLFIRVWLLAIIIV